MSILPSPLKSADTPENGLDPVGYVSPFLKAPFPDPKKISILSKVRVTATSSFSSPLKSAGMIASGTFPVLTPGSLRKDPFP